MLLYGYSVKKYKFFERISFRYQYSCPLLLQQFPCSLQYSLIRNKFSTTGNALQLVNSVINDFESQEQDPVIPSYLVNDFELKPHCFN